MRRLFLILSLVLSAGLAGAQTLSEQAEIYLLTCTAGEEVWSQYGHTGIRVVDKAQDIDVAFNYGIFSFQTEGFYLKFVRGETYYQLGIEPYRYFREFYGSIGRKTYWQRLNLTLEQKQQVFDDLLTNYLPENRFYLYNFVFDNCATRPYHILKHALGDTIISTYKGYEGTPYREAISRYTGRHSWVDFGINMVFGKEADEPMDSEARLFLPEELMWYMAEARLADGTPLVEEQEVAAFEEARTPWYADCRFGIALFALLLLALSIWDRRRGKMTYWVDILLIIIYLVLIAISVFLTFFSVHPLVGFNWRLLLLPAIHLCARLIYWQKYIH
ncbi:MAG: DUF4105 domain-containing protein [Paludibacteraceae bacterium]